MRKRNRFISIMKNHKISALAPKSETGKQYHIQCGEGDVAPYVLMPGDPDRVPLIASDWQNVTDLGRHREYHTITGTTNGVYITATSSGIGCPSLAIAVDELYRIGAETIIRVGSTGCLQPDMNIGDLVISTGAVRLEGTSKDFVIPEFPALSHYEVVMALIQAAEALHERYHVGITASTDTFYGGQGRPGFNNYFPSFKKTILEDLQSAGVKNFEMEASTLFTMATIFGKRAGAICFVIANRVTNEFQITEDMAIRAGRVATKAIEILSSWDERKRKHHKKWLYPELV